MRSGVADPLGYDVMYVSAVALVAVTLSTTAWAEAGTPPWPTTCSADLATGAERGERCAEPGAGVEQARRAQRRCAATPPPVKQPTTSAIRSTSPSLT